MVLTNASELKLFSAWINGAAQHPVSRWSFDSYPGAVHRLILNSSSGPVIILLSGGTPLRRQPVDGMPGLVWSLTILRFPDGVDYRAESVPEVVVYPNG